MVAEVLATSPPAVTWKVEKIRHELGGIAKSPQVWGPQHWLWGAGWRRGQESVQEQVEIWVWLSPAHGGGSGERWFDGKAETPLLLLRRCGSCVREVVVNG